MAYQAVEEIQNRCEKESIPFWKAVQLEDCEENGITEEESWQQMTLMWTRMKEGVDAYNPSEISRSGLVGKEGGLMDEYRQNEKPLCGDFVSKVIANALKMGCNNACMKRIVAAPTAGACGVMPAVLVTYFREYGVEEEKKEVEDGNANKISNDSKCDCPFAPRCEKFSECCMEYQHRYIEVEPNHFVMCCNKHL